MLRNRIISVVKRKERFYEGKVGGGEISKPQNIEMLQKSDCRSIILVSTKKLSVRLRRLITKENVCQLFLHQSVLFLVTEISGSRKRKHPIMGGIDPIRSMMMQPQ
jgi:hypothetical protein